MWKRGRSRARRILTGVLVLFLVVSVGQFLVQRQGGALAGVLLAGLFGAACFRAGRRRPQAPGSAAPRAAAPRRSSLGPRIIRDIARLIVSRF
jgi:hypothetical protein